MYSRRQVDNLSPFFVEGTRRTAFCKRRINSTKVMFDFFDRRNVDRLLPYFYLSEAF